MEYRPFSELKNAQYSSLRMAIVVENLGPRRHQPTPHGNARVSPERTTYRQFFNFLLLLFFSSLSRTLNFKNFMLNFELARSTTTRLTFVVSITIMIFFFLGRRRGRIIFFYFFFLIKTENWSFRFKIQFFYNHLLLLRSCLFFFFLFNATYRIGRHVYFICGHPVYTSSQYTPRSQ